MEKILIIDDDDYLRSELESILLEPGRKFYFASNGKEALEFISRKMVDLVLTDIRMPEMDGFEFIKRVKKRWSRLPVITLTAYPTTETAIQALRIGAYDFIKKPFSVEELRNIVEHALEASRLFDEVHYLRGRLDKRYSMDNMIGQSSPMQKLFATISRLAKSSCNVLITGESGTGKDLVAQAIHHHSDRKDRRFVPINCASIPEGLLESELFGYVKGAFTGAYRDKTGLVQAADGGTLFLDEIGDMPLSLQVRLLRLIQNRQLQRVGSTKTEDVDVRIVAATNQNIVKNIQKGNFREDLYYRINVVGVHLPPLREREGDIELLALHFLKVFASQINKDVEGFSSVVMRALQSYHWPGNVRELENAIERAVTMCDSSRIELIDLPESIETSLAGASLFNGTLAERVECFESQCIRRVMKSNDGDLELVAKDLGVSLATLYRKLKRLGIKPSSSRIVEYTPPGQKVLEESVAGDDPGWLF